MSVCISRHGEFGSHTHTVDPLTCDLCDVFDEDAARQRIAELERTVRPATAGPHPLERLIAVVHRADRFKQEQLATNWPELADALVGLIEGTTEHDAPRAWHVKPACAPLTAEDSMLLYGVVYQDAAGTVLHPRKLQVLINPITGKPMGYKIVR